MACRCTATPPEFDGDFIGQRVTTSCECQPDPCADSVLGVCCHDGVCSTISCTECLDTGGSWFEGPADCDSCGDCCSAAFAAQRRVSARQLRTRLLRIPVVWEWETKKNQWRRMLRETPAWAKCAPPPFDGVFYGQQVETICLVPG